MLRAEPAEGGQGTLRALGQGEASDDHSCNICRPWLPMKSDNVFPEHRKWSKLIDSVIQLLKDYLQRNGPNEKHVEKCFF